MRPIPSRLPPIVTALLIQALAVAVVLAALPLLGWRLSAAAAAVLVAALAALLTAMTALERWWIALQILLPPLLVLLVWIDGPAWIYPALFLAVAVCYVTTVRTRVPLYLSGPRTWQAVASLLPPACEGATPRFIDLGSGLGGLLAELGRRRPDMRFEGVELAPLPALLSWLRMRLGRRGNVRVRWGSFWPLDLAPYDVVFAFLSPVPMADLWNKAQREMRPGSLLVSCAFEVPGQRPDRVIELSSARQSRLLVWRIAARN